MEKGCEHLNHVYLHRWNCARNPVCGSHWLSDCRILQIPRQALKGQYQARTGSNNQKKQGEIMSLRKAINEKCRDCVYDKSNLGNFVQQVSMCPQMDCPLWKVRPVSRKWAKSLSLHDEQVMLVWHGLSAEQFYRNIMELCGGQIDE